LFFDEQFFDEHALRTRFDARQFPVFRARLDVESRTARKFRQTPNAVLFATSSFWQGVDVRGEQLSCVIIDKLPFAVPTDPIVAARTVLLTKRRQIVFRLLGSASRHYFKQGIGRLIRSKTDKGVIALLDSRLKTKGYGKDFLKVCRERELRAN
jgi:Rad3-related DNA helicase